MKLALVTLFALLAAANAGVIQIDLEDITAYNYLEKIGLPLAEEIRKAEESNSRIVGGSPAPIIPYQVGLIAQFAQGQGVCGGSVLTNTRVVTAAHCWWDGVNQARSFTLVYGSRTLFSGGTRINSNQVVMHGSWNPTLVRNDVAVIRTSHVGYTANINAIPMATGTATFAGVNALVSGFGLTSDNGAIASNQVLSQVNVPVITNAACSPSFPFLIQAANICTSGANGRSPCRGDSGGPLVTQVGGRLTQIGIVSFGSASGCQRGHPAVYARVTSHTAFIHNS